MKIPWHKGPDGFPEGEECVAYYEIFPIGSCYIPVTKFDRGVIKWITVKELNSFYGIKDWTAKDHCDSLN